MHRFASAILGFMLSPFNWIWILLILSFLSRNGKVRRRCRIAALVILVVFGNQWILDWAARRWQPKRVPAGDLKTYSCGIVLGGFGSPDAGGTGYFNENADRFIEAEKMYKLGIIHHILISGGNGKTDEASFREAWWAKKEFGSLGIPDSVIFVEDRSNDTQDNAAYAKEILDSLQFEPPYLLITSAIHMPRASLIFKNAGLRTQPFPCGYAEGVGPFEWSDALPQASVLSSWKLLMKEFAGYAWYAVTRR